jgi:hypothetical protein
VFAASLLERAVSLHGDMVVRAVYGTFKPEIDRAIKGQLRGIKIQVPEMLRYPAQVQARGKSGGQAPKQAQVKPTKPAPAPAPSTTTPPVMDMHVGSDGVYEVSDAT